MHSHSKSYLYALLHSRKRHFPWEGQLELTYDCNLRCAHCYCRGSEKAGRLLSTREYKGLLDQFSAAGCLWLVFTGGEPLLRPDFKELYMYARAKGFIVTLFTNGILLDRSMVSFLSRRPPALIEITLNGVTAGTYGAITGVPSALPRVISAVKMLKKHGLPVLVKTNLLRQNAHEVVDVKRFVEKLFGRQREGVFRFRYDMMVYARLNGDTAPCALRADFQDILAVHRRDPQMWEGLQGLLGNCSLRGGRSDRLYRCDAWRQQFVVDPFGQMRICTFTRSIVADLRRHSFTDAFYRILPALVEQRSTARSVCRSCRMRYFCFFCPARGYLETGDERLPVKDFCVLARQMRAWSTGQQRRQKR